MSTQSAHFEWDVAQICWLEVQHSKGDDHLQGGESKGDLVQGGCAVDGEEREREAEGGVHQGAVLSHTGGQRGGLCTLVQVQTLAQVFLSRVNQGCIGS